MTSLAVQGWKHTPYQKKSGEVGAARGYSALLYGRLVGILPPPVFPCDTGSDENLACFTGRRGFLFCVFSQSYATRLLPVPRFWSIGWDVHLLPFKVRTSSRSGEHGPM